MSQNNKLQTTEMLLRGLRREGSKELKQRPNKDESDFQRNPEHWRTGIPENGISMFRAKYFKDSQAFYNRLQITRPVGKADGPVSVLVKKFKLKPLRDPLDEEDHISLRCPNCDEALEGQAICKPKGAKTHLECPLYDLLGLCFDISQLFRERESPARRVIQLKPKDTTASST